MGMKTSLLLAFGVIVLAIVACGCTAPVGPAPVATTPVSTIPPGSPIVGPWVLESMVNGGTPVALVPRTMITAVFGQNGMLSGNDGCNQYSGSYTVTGSQVQVSPALASTMMACEPAVMDQAQTYTRILLGPGIWQVSGDRLTIQDTSGRNILVYVKQVPATPTMAPPASPVGSWDLTSMTGVSGGSSFVQNPTGTITAIFGTDGTVQGSGGCNAYSAGYTTSGASMTVSGMINTLMSCGNVLDTQERAYMTILGNAARFENTGTQLTIFDAKTPGSKLVYKPGTAKPLPIPVAIVGTWSLTGMSKSGASMTLASGIKTTATFAADGMLSGNGGCNQYSGSYVLTGTSAIAVSPLATTRMMCPDPAMTQETNYLGILQNAATWVVSGTPGQLTITDSTSGQNTLVYSKTA